MRRGNGPISLAVRLARVDGAALLRFCKQMLLPLGAPVAPATMAAAFIGARSMSEIQHLPTLCSVVLLRVRDYARRPVAEQARLTAQLETVLALLLPDIPARSRIVLEDHGLAVVAVLDNPPAALRLAERALHAEVAGLALGIGVDHGPVEIVAGDRGESLAGDGVATASVLSAFATEAGLLVSKDFRTALAQRDPAAPVMLVSAGQFSDAGLRSYQAYRVDHGARRWRRRNFAIVAASTALLVLGAAMALRSMAPDRPRPLAPYWEKIEAQYLGQPARTSRGRR